MPRSAAVTTAACTGGPNRAFRRIRERAGVRGLPPHSLRHATASILLAAGVPVAVAAKMMGHSVAMFCEIYADLLVEATHDAARQADQWLARRAVPPPSPGGDGAGKAEPRRPGRKAAAGRRWW
jgi:integrase